MNIILDVIDVPNGQVAVIPSIDRVNASCATMERRVEELLDKKGTEEELAENKRQIDYLRREIAETRRLDQVLRTQYDVRQLSFESRGYTSGIEKKSKIAATTYVDGRARFDRVQYEDLLVCHALDKEMNWLDEQPPAVVAALRNEVVDKGQPDPARLAFLSSVPTSSPKTDS